MKYAFFLILMVFLIGCGDSNQQPVEPVADSGGIASEDGLSDEAAIEYQKKVQKRVSNVVVNSLAKEWGVPEDKVKCVMGQLKFSEIQEVHSNPEAQAVFNDCGVDPSVID